jgi:molybdenum cofactor cytidylyltransferase
LISGVVLAAGESARFGVHKQLLKIGGRTLLETVVGKFSESRVDEVVVVLGCDSKFIQRKVALGRARVVTNTDYEKGLSSSIRAGIEAVRPESRAVILALGDQPLISIATIDALVQKYLETGGPVVAPYFRRRRGNPVLFDRQLFPYLKKIEGDRGAKAAIKEHGWRVVRVDVKDPGVLLDIDSEADYRRVLRELSEGR